MNGHSSGETLAFSLLEIARRWGRSLGDADDAPVFILAAGWNSGETELRQRLPYTLASDLAIDPALLGALAFQLARVGGATREGASCDVPAEGGQTDSGLTLAEVTAAHVRFVGTLCQTPRQSRVHASWGFTSTGLTGDYAIYLRLLFSRAKFIFLHRNPLDTFAACVSSVGAAEFAKERRPELAASFAEQWCRLVTSFELWHNEVGGILVGYERALAAEPREVEEYLGERLRPSCAFAEEADHERRLPALGRDEVKLIVERTGDIAARYGYRLAGAETAGVVGSFPERSAKSATQAVHSESARLSCAVLVPAMRYIEPECDEALRELQRRGYTVRRLLGCPAN